MTTLHGAQPTDLSDAALREAVGTVLDPYRDAVAGQSDGYDGDASDDGRVVVLPDAHYPYHPSTGLVTNPAVVRAVVADLVDDVGADRVAVGVPGSELIDAERAAKFLGYERLAREAGVDLLDLDAAETVERMVHLTRESATVAVPEPLASGRVICVPTLRKSAARGVEGALLCLARAVAEDPTAEQALAAVHACPPAATLLDGTYVYAGEPRRSRFLLAGDDPVAADVLGAKLLRIDRAAVAGLDSYEGESRGPTAVEGLDLRAIAESLPRTEAHDPGDDALMAKGYGLYAKVSGDLVPPQLLRAGGEDDE